MGRNLILHVEGWRFQSHGSPIVLLFNVRREIRGKTRMVENRPQRQMWQPNDERVLLPRLQGLSGPPELLCHFLMSLLTTREDG